jgi:peptidoglycan/xylan/chitin deacetylase (PgdA/CDA1 family)
MRIPILTYHSIDESGSVVSTSPERFQRQMRQLHESSCQVLPLREIATALRENRELPANVLALTFDDGFESVYSHAFPLLQEFGFPATVFLVTGYCGSQSVWNRRTPKIGPAPLATWDQIAEMSNWGIEIGSHSVTHPDLTRVRPSKAEREIRSSRRMIEDRLSKPVTAFAYPFGHSNAEVRAMVEAQYQYACSTRLGMVESGSAPYRLKRVEMYYFSSDEHFESLLNGQADSYLAMRGMLRFVRALV